MRMRIGMEIIEEDEDRDRDGDDNNVMQTHD